MEHRAASLRQLSQVRIYTEYAIMKAVKVQYTNYHTHTRTRARGSMRVILDAKTLQPIITEFCALNSVADMQTFIPTPFAVLLPICVKCAPPLPQNVRLSVCHTPVFGRHR